MAVRSSADFYTKESGIAIARACIRDGARGRFYTVVDLVNRLEAEARAGRQGRLADQLCRVDLVALDELGYLVAREQRCRPRNSSTFWPMEVSVIARSLSAAGENLAKPRFC
jgi:hypothetical protein